MKKILAYTSLLLLSLFACKSMHEIEAPQPFVIKHTWAEVIAIAAKYGVDSTYIPYDKQNALMLDDEPEIARFVLMTKHSLDLRKQRREFMANNYKIRNYADYEALLAQYPLALESYKKAMGSDLEKRAEQMRKGTWHIYRNSIGALRWVRPEDDKGHYEGEERIDNKPRVNN
jgi:hypothetical protein